MVAPQTVASLIRVCGSPLGLYLPAGGNDYAPAAAPEIFRCAPSPVSVTPATFLPAPTVLPDDVIRTTLGRLGLDNATIQRFERNGGFVAMRPIAIEVGDSVLEELLRRLRYNLGRIADPPHTRSLSTKLRIPAPPASRATVTLMIIIAMVIIMTTTIMTMMTTITGPVNI